MMIKNGKDAAKKLEELIDQNGPDYLDLARKST